MNVVGRVGNIISQGLYTVLIPFHPFGGAIDVIVVQQQDGTFRSTPWRVRFGKFQGVLKGAEKVVGITVNGVEANFHMYLDNSGEAYFVEEVGVTNDSIINDSTDVDGNDLDGSNGVDDTSGKMPDELGRFYFEKNERVESESEQRLDSREGNDNFDSRENHMPSNFTVEINASEIDVEFHNNVADDFEYLLKVCEGEDGHVFHSEDSQINKSILVSTSCLEASEHVRLDFENSVSSLADSNSEVRGIENPPVCDETRKDCVIESISNGLSSNSENKGQNDSLVYLKNNRINRAEKPETIDDIVLNDEGNRYELLNFCSENSNERMENLHTTKFEISLCGSKLHSGMGSSAAAKAFDDYRLSAREFKSSATSLIRNENLIIRFRGNYWHWEKVAPAVLGMAAFGLDLPLDPMDAVPVERDESISAKNESRWSLWPIPLSISKRNEVDGNNSSNEDVFLDAKSELPSPTLTSEQCDDSRDKRVIKTNIPSSEQIASLNLKEGQNRIEFTFFTRVLGEQKVDAHIYLWKWNARIVVSDVDGTITKSDVLGQFMPLVGMDWTQSGVARFFSAIKENGYQLLFLSARAIVQAYLTRSFLLNLKQDGEALPHGPVVISPDGLFPSLYREVIRRAPHEFKIACLEEIRKLFPSDHNPFYAGFGNRDTDELSYVKMEIPKGKIFIINPKGEVVNSHCNNVKSYTSLFELVDVMFPPSSSIEQESFNSWNYWKMPLSFSEID